jgi:metallo-beta-lactamase family protein
MDVLEKLFHEAVAKGSVVLVPSFAIGRTQELLYFISQLQSADRVPRLPIFVDSPMATATTLVTMQHEEEHDHDMKILLEEGKSPIQPKLLEFVRDSNQSKMLNSRPGPMLIISGSGMATGGRIVHHLKQRLSDPSTIVLFTGYQAEGTLGRRMLDGAVSVEIHGEAVPVRASVRQLTSLSAHADSEEVLRWLENFKTPPKRTFVVHGEPPAQAALRAKIESRLGWSVTIPKQGETFELS